MPLPRIGLGVASHGQPLSERELDRLRALHVAHLRVDLNLASDDYGALLRQAGEQARALGVSLEVALTLSDAARTNWRRSRCADGDQAAGSRLADLPRRSAFDR